MKGPKEVKRPGGSLIPSLQLTVSRHNIGDVQGAAQACGLSSQAAPAGARRRQPTSIVGDCHLTSTSSTSKLSTEFGGIVPFTPLDPYPICSQAPPRPHVRNGQARCRLSMAHTRKQVVIYCSPGWDSISHLRGDCEPAHVPYPHALHPAIPPCGPGSTAQRSSAHSSHVGLIQLYSSPCPDGS